MSAWGPLVPPRNVHRDVQDLLRELQGEGDWEMRHGKRHLLVRHPLLGIFTISGTPSDWRTVRNIRADIDRRRRLAMDG